MFKCLICNKFSFFLDEKSICRNCFNKYSSEAKNMVEVRINLLFSLIDDKDNSLEYRKEKLDELEYLYNEFIQTRAGRVLRIYDPSTYDEIKKEIDNSKNEFDSLFHKKEIIKYSKIYATPESYVVFDLETTGLNNENDAILEIGAIKYLNNVETARFHTYVNPMRSIPKAASAINHITASTVKYAPVIHSALKDFLTFIDNLTLIAFNSDFDMGFIQMNCYNNFGSTVANDVIDALPLARKYLPQLPNKKLETIKQHFGLKVGSHNALDDCIVTNHLYQYCRQYEELKYRYIIPFSYNQRELSEKEIEYLNTIVSIFEKNGVMKTALSMRPIGSLISIEENNVPLISFKLDGKLQYVLLEIPFEIFELKYSTNVKHTISSKTEGYLTRLFIDNASQLWEFEKIIVPGI